MSRAFERRQLPLLVVIVLCALITQFGAVGSVLTADVAAAFPGAGDAAVQAMLQCSVVGSFAGSLAVSALAGRVAAKARVLGGLAGELLGGLMPLVGTVSLPQLWVAALLVGLGQSTVVATLGELCLDGFTGRARARALGLNSAANNGGAAAVLFVAGRLALAVGWRGVFWLYLLVVPVLVTAALVLKAPVPEKAPESAPLPKGDAVGARGRALCALAAVSLLAYAVVPFNLALYVVRDAAIGTTADAGAAMGLVTLAAALSSLALPWLTRRLGLFVAVVPPVAGLVGCLVLLGATNMGAVFAATVCEGVFLGVTQASMGYLIGRVCPGAAYGRAYGLGTAMISLGQILCLPVIDGLGALAGLAGSLARFGFWVSAGLFGCLVLAQTLWVLWARRDAPRTTE